MWKGPESVVIAPCSSRYEYTGSGLLTVASERDSPSLCIINCPLLRVFSPDQHVCLSVTTFQSTGYVRTSLNNESHELSTCSYI